VPVIAGAPADTGTPDDGAAAAATEFAALMFLTSPASVRVEAAVFSVDPELSILPTPSQPLAAGIAPLLSAPQPADSGSEVDRVGEASAESFDIPETLDFAALGNTDPLWPDNPGDGF